MIILTGASGGIGEEMLSGLSKLDDVIGIYNSSTPKTDISKRVSLQKLDLRNENEINLFIQENKSILKNISVIHAAGTSEDNLAINHKLDEWENVLELNLTANFLLTKALIPLMVKQKWGRVIHFSSIRVASGAISYTTTKHGLLGMSKVLAKEYAKFNITSNSLILGAFNTGMFQNLNKKVKKEMIDQIPSKEIGEVENIVSAIKFIVDSPFVNGASIRIDGGASI
jgi:NAD(P)-dependent dehydrogenase (short-subunit alcohol dehydrogenase family)